MPGGGFVSTSTDITERKRTEARMLHLAQHDALTGLPNRLLFNDRLQQAMARCRRNGSLMAVILLDLDKFKQVNDALGHPVGDGVLKQTGERLRAALRASDTVARIGGDEFALILQDLPDVRAATTIADKLVEPARPAVRSRRRALWQPRASLGIALFPSDGATAEQLLQNADLAMYRAKAAGGGFELAAGTIRRGFDHRHGLEHDLGRAIERGQLTLEYQPQLDLRSERVSGVEALLRWHHPDLGAIAPETLIRLAEASGQIAAIGEWALARGLRGRPPAGRAAGSRSGSRSISPRASWLGSDFVALVRRILDASGLPAERLELELTETSMLNEIDRVTATLAALHGHGRGAGARRLRHRLRQPQPSPAVPARRPQDRPLVRRRPRAGARCGGCGDRALADRARPPPGHEGDRRGGRERRRSWRRCAGSAAMRSRATWSAILWRRTRSAAGWRASRAEGRPALTFARPPLRKPLPAAPPGAQRTRFRLR